MYGDPQRESRVSLSYTFGMSEEKSVEATHRVKKTKERRTGRGWRKEREREGWDISYRRG